MRDLTDQQRARIESVVKDWRPIKEAPGAYGAGPATVAQSVELERLRALITAPR